MKLGHKHLGNIPQSRRAPVVGLKICSFVHGTTCTGYYHRAARFLLLKTSKRGNSATYVQRCRERTCTRELVWSCQLRVAQRFHLWMAVASLRCSRLDWDRQLAHAILRLHCAATYIVSDIWYTHPKGVPTIGETQRACRSTPLERIRCPEIFLSLNNYEAGNLHHVVDSRNILNLSFTTDQLKNSGNHDFERKGTLCAWSSIWPR